MCAIRKYIKFGLCVEMGKDLNTGLLKYFVLNTKRVRNIFIKISSRADDTQETKIGLFGC